MLSSCYHGGSANTTQDEERLIFSCFMTRGWLRQEENQYLAVPLEVAKTLPLRIQRLMGYAISEVRSGPSHDALARVVSDSMLTSPLQPMLGWVDFKDPLVVIDATNANRVAHKKPA